MAGKPEGGVATATAALTAPSTKPSTKPSNQPQTLQPLVFVQNDFRLTASNCPTQAT